MTPSDREGVRRLFCAGLKGTSGTVNDWPHRCGGGLLHAKGQISAGRGWPSRRARW